MSEIFRNFLDRLKLTEEDEDEYEDYVAEELEREQKRNSKIEKRLNKQTASTSNGFEETAATTHASEPKKERVQKMERLNGGKVVPIRTTTKGFEVCIMKPITFEDSQEICDMLLSGRAAVINLEGFDVELAQRIMDFVSGAVYSLEGKLHQISSYIFIISPNSVDISGDYADLIKNDGFEVPTLNKEF